MTLLCPVIGCEQERKCHDYCTELEGGNGRARVNAEFEYWEFCKRCQTSVGWKRKEDGSLRILRPPNRSESTAA